MAGTIPALQHALCRPLALRACALEWALLHGIGAAQPTRFEIGLIGDLPYSGEDEAKFPNLMQAMNEANLAFVVHVGDIETDPRLYKHDQTGAIRALMTPSPSARRCCTPRSIPSSSRLAITTGRTATLRNQPLTTSNV